MKCSGLIPYRKMDSLLEVILMIAWMLGPTCAMMKKSYACATGYCILFNISCMADEHILIRNASYGFGDYQDCKTDVDSCRHENKKGCCTKAERDQMKPFVVSHKYNIFKACSWKPNCSKQTDQGYLNETHARYSLLEYECQKGSRDVHLCTNENVTGNTVNLIFNGNKTLDTKTADCMCIFETTNSDKNYSISAPDLRLQSESENCSTETRISGLADTDIKCNTSFTSTRPYTRTANSSLKISFKSRPEFIWIEAKGRGAEVSVKCYGPNEELPVTNATTEPTSTTTSAPTLVSTNATATRTVASTQTSTTTTTTTTTYSVNSTTEDTLSTASGTTDMKTTLHSSSHSPTVLEVQADDSNGVPLPAIIVPLLLIFVGAGIIGFFIWRRRHSKNVKADQLDGRSRTNFETQTPCRNISNYDNIAPPRTADNYIDIELENTYSSIDHNDTSYEYQTAGRNSGSTEVAPRKTSAIQNNPYFILEPQNSNPSTENSVASNKVETCKDSVVGAKTAESITSEHKENHEYFVLEPNDGNVSMELCGQNNNKTAQSPQPRDSEAESHNYFVLEPETVKRSVDAKNEKTKLDMEEKRKEEQKVPVKDKTENHNYFVLEPQDTYSSINPNDVVVQTLPDDEYNVLSMKMKSKGMSQDPNYDGLKSEHLTDKSEDGGEYSHIGDGLVAEKISKEYSHVNFKKSKAENQEEYGNEYSQLGFPAAKPADAPAESNDYAHLQGKV